MGLPARKPKPPDDDSTTPILKLIEDVVPNYRLWIDAPNGALGGHAPRDLIGTPDERLLRQMVLAYKYGIYS
jgi:hypothetical protein